MINEELIFLDKNFDSKKQVFEFLAQECTAKKISDNKEALMRALIGRENQGTTGMMNGFAIPHAKSEHIHQASIAIIKNNQGIEWESMDGELITFVIAMFIPENEKGTGHLNVLSKVARMLMKEDVKGQLKDAQTVSELKEILLANVN